MVEIQDVKDELYFLTSQYDCASGNGYYAIEDKKKVLGRCNDRFANSWKDGNGAVAMSCSNKIYQELGCAKSQFEIIVCNVNQVIKGAKRMEETRREKGLDKFGNKIDVSN